MRVLKVTGPGEVAALLRKLADEIDRRAVELHGRPVALSDSLEAVVELAEGGPTEVSLIDIRLEHPAPAVWSLTELQEVLAHPGD